MTLLGKPTGVLVAWRGEPDPPQRPEREERRPGPGRWTALILILIVGTVITSRFLGTAGIVVVWLSLILIGTVVQWVRKRP